ncbi:unnamed protein product [Danaus chrysippus]|uniref:(African queen) hypothetical protein n=1 Tax=Danaus chrysippus TaxID=151541 RepID=A0A8J2QJZ1_9NEOP|nr:unnamed protein product [Danaus chrysippus]
MRHLRGEVARAAAVRVDRLVARLRSGAHLHTTPSLRRRHHPPRTPLLTDSPHTTTVKGFTYWVANNVLNIAISFIGVSASSKSFVKQQNNNKLANQISLMVRVERFGSADATNELQRLRKSSESVQAEEACREAVEKCRQGCGPHSGAGHGTVRDYESNI